MGSRLSDDSRRRLLAMLAEDRPDAERWVARLRKLRADKDLGAFSELLRLLVNLVLNETEAERVLRRILEHRASLARSLGRDPGLRVSAVDYLSNVEPRLDNPKIVEMAQFEKTVQSALTDPLTGLFNRRELENSIEREIARGRRHEHPFSLLLLDLDGFKTVNDAHGHLVGDLALKRTARILRRIVRDVDVACRVGGDEFAVLLPETGRLGALSVAERIRNRIREAFAERRTGGRDVRLTVSGGIAAHPEDGADANRLLACADRSLYEAKRGGRDHVAVHHDDRRRDVRYPFRQSARIRLGIGDDPPGEARGIDLSSSGALVETLAAPGPESRVAVRIDSRRRDRVVPVWGTSGIVVRVENESGPSRRIAVRFDDRLSPERLAGFALAPMPRVFPDQRGVS